MTKIPWERRPDESTKAYDAFCHYRNIPRARRSIHAAHTAAGKPSGTIRYWEIWSSKYEWIGRATAWDDHWQRLADKVKEDEFVEMEKRHQAYAQNLLAVASLPMQEIARRINAEEIDLTAIDVDELMQLTRTLSTAGVKAANLERISKGKPTEITEHQGQGGGPIQVVDPLAAAVARDPEARAAALKLLASLDQKAAATQ